jgi:RND family efflux transporter MFP subunit
MARTKARGLWIGTALAAAAAGLAYGAYAARDDISAIVGSEAGYPAEAAPRPAQPVRVTRVAYAAPAALASYTGTVRPQIESDLGFRVAGKLMLRMVEIGDRVAAGQVLARLDDSDARLDLEAAEAERDAARTDLARAGAEALRSRNLHAAGHVAQAVLDRAVSAEAEAQARLDRAERLRDQAANRLGYAALRADAAGVVTAVTAEPGQVVAAGQPVVSVARTDAFDVVFALPEQMRERLEGTEATAALWGTEGPAFPLSFRDIAPDADPASRTYRVRMAVAAPDARIAFGRTVTVTLAGPAAAPVVALPLAAVINDGSGPAVWRLPAGADRVERVAVEVAAIGGRVAAVRGGLEEGDRVVSLGAALIDPDRPVRVVETAVAPAF